MAATSANTGSAAAPTVHPMVAVPDAIHLVLRETARSLLHPRGEQTLSLEQTELLQLIHQRLSRDVLMQEPGYPPYRASIMDGYCIQSTDNFTTSGEGKFRSWTHRVIDKVLAGDHVASKELGSSPDAGELPTAYYVTTGARVPDGYDCVVPIEDVEVHSLGQRISIRCVPSKAGKWIRPVGCDIPPESCVLPAGHVIEPVSLGLLKQSGNSTVHLCRPVTVGVLSTGNELLTDEWEPITDGRQGKIPDVNRPILLSFLQSLGICNVLDLGICRDDDPSSMATTIRNALTTCEVVITTGGISMGETDIVEDVLVRLLGGTLHFGRLHMKPGKPSTFVTLPYQQDTTRFVFALPGNPVSAVVCSHLLVRPCLQLLYEGPDMSVGQCQDSSPDGWIARVVEASTLAPPELLVELGHDISLDAERPEYHRVRLDFDSTRNRWIANSTGTQRSSRLMSLRDADALLVLPQATPAKPRAWKGETFPSLLLGNHVLPPTKVSDSQHLNNSRASSVFRVGIVQVGAEMDAEQLTHRILVALRHSQQDPTPILSTARTFDGNIDSLYRYITQDTQADVHIVVGSCQRGSIAYNSQVSQHLRSHLVKLTDSVALEMRRGVASRYHHAALGLFENVVGIVTGRPGHPDDSLLVFVAREGADDSLANVRGLLRHCLKIARGQGHSK